MKLMLTSVSDCGQVSFHPFEIVMNEIISKSGIIQQASELRASFISIVVTFNYTEKIHHLVENIMNGSEIIKQDSLDSQIIIINDQSMQILGENETDNFITFNLNENGKRLFDSVSTDDILSILLVLDRLDLKNHITALVEYLKLERKMKRKDVIKFVYDNRLNEAKLWGH